MIGKLAATTGLEQMLHVQLDNLITSGSVPLRAGLRGSTFRGYPRRLCRFSDFLKVASQVCGIADCTVRVLAIRHRPWRGHFHPRDRDATDRTRESVLQLFRGICDVSQRILPQLEDYTCVSIGNLRDPILS